MTVLALLLAVSLSAGSEEFDAAAKNGAAEIAVGRVRRALAAQGAATGTLSRAMLADPAAYRTRAEAERRARDVYDQSVEEAFRREAEAIRTRLGLEEIPAAWSAADRERASAPFAESFRRERAAACAAQARSLATGTRPSEAEIEAKDDATLKREMAQRIAASQKTPVFEENLAYISESVVAPAIEGAHRERSRQKEYLMRARSDALAPDALAKDLAAHLEANVAERRRRAEDPALAWGVFPGVLKDELPKAVERRTVERVAKAVGETAFSPDPASIRKTIAARPAAHRRASDSERVFRGVYAAALVERAVAKACDGASAADREAFSAYIAKRAGAAEISKAVDSRIRREVLPEWRKARETLAAEEAKRLWPKLEDGTWYPETALADRTAARSDFDEAVRRWRKEPTLAPLARTEGVLEETDRAADRAVAAAFSRARKARTAQNALVDRAEPEILAEAKDRKSSFWRRTPDLKALVGLLTAKIEGDWMAIREKTLWPDGKKPKNASEQHVALFPSVKRRIELVARSILEEIEKPEEEDPKDGETPPQLLYSIVVERAGDRVKVKLSKDGETVAEEMPKAKMGDFRNAMRTVSDKLGREILKLK